MKNNMVLEEDKDVRTTPSMRLLTEQTGKPSLFLDTDTLSHRDVPGPMSLTGMDDKKRNLTEEIPVTKEPVSEELGHEAVMDDDLLAHHTQREEEKSMRMKRMPEGGKKNTDQRCSYSKKGRCKIHGDGARKIPIMVKESVVGEGGTKTTKSTKKYVWRCDVNKRGNKMIQSSISSFLSKKNPENTGGWRALLTSRGTWFLVLIIQWGNEQTRADHYHTLVMWRGLVNLMTGIQHDRNVQREKA